MVNVVYSHVRILNSTDLSVQQTMGKDA